MAKRERLRSHRERDEEILDIAAEDGRLLVSHDVNTMTATFKAHVDVGRRVPGLLLVPQSLPVGDVIAELELIYVASEPADWAGVLVFLPV